MSDMNWTPGDIAKACANNNPSGLKPELHVTTEIEINTIPAATELKITGDITMAAASPPEIPLAGAFKVWGTTEEPAKYFYRAEQTGDRDSASINHILEVSLPKATAERIWAARAGCAHMVIFTDKGGIKRLMGEKGNGCSMNWSAEINETSNHQKIIFTFTAGRPLYEYTGAIPV